VVRGDPMPSPYVYDSGGDYRERRLTGAFSFNVANRSLSGLLVHRDPGCVYVAVLIGDPNGTPIRVPPSGAVAEGDTNISKAQLNSVGLNTIEDVLALQITATA
jgi:hypothetical protein